MIAPAKRILIVDDERELRSVLHEFLEEDGFDVFEAGNGRDALDLLRATTIDLAIVDLFMPGMDGLELLSELRKQDAAPKIVAISGGSETQSGDIPLEVACRLGASVGLAKPFDFEILLSHVKSCLEP